MAPTVKERNLLEAWLHGWSVILCVIAATLALVIGLLVALDGVTPWAAVEGLLCLLLAAGGCAYLSRVARRGWPRTRAWLLMRLRDSA